MWGPPTAKVDEPFSTRAEEKRQEARGKKKRQRKPKGRRGRVSTDDKVRAGGANRSRFSRRRLCRTRVRCRTFGRCGVWRTVERCWSRTRSIAARATAMARSPACWAAASTVWRSSPRSPIWFISSACPSTKSVFSSISSRTCASASRRPTRCFIGCRAIGNTSSTLLCTLLANSLVVHADETQLEFEQRLGVSLGEGSRAVVRRA